MVSRRGFGRAVIGIGISIVALFLVVRSVDLAATWNTIITAQPQWIAAMVAFMVIDIGLRALRWRVLLRPVSRGWSEVARWRQNSSAKRWSREAK